MKWLESGCCAAGQTTQNDCLPHGWRLLYDSNVAIGFQVGEFLFRASRPRNLDRFDAGFGTQAEMHPLIARRHKAYANGHMVVQRTPRRCDDLDPRPNRIPVAVGPYQFE